MQENVKNLLIRIFRELLVATGEDEDVVVFMIALMIQDMKNNVLYEQIINEIENKYSVRFEADYTRYTLGTIHIWSDLDLVYDIVFSGRILLLGYCRCLPGDEGYRVDKNCCGHNCDWFVPMFQIYRLGKQIYSYMWQGDQASYWEFQDEWNTEKFLNSKL